MSQLSIYDREQEIFQCLINPKADVDKFIQEVCDRILFCDDAIRQYGAKNVVSGLLVKKYSYSKRQAYLDIELTQHIMCTVVKVNKAAEKQWLADKLKSAIVKAEKEGRLKELASLSDQYTKLLRLDKDDSDLPDWSKFVIPRPQMGLYPEMTGVEIPDNLEERINSLIKKNEKKRTIINDEDVTDATEIGSSDSQE